MEHHCPEIASADSEIPSALNDRAADIWAPLFAIADFADADWPNIARQAPNAEDTCWRRLRVRLRGMCETGCIQSSSCR